MTNKLHNSIIAFTIFYPCFKIYTFMVQYKGTKRRRKMFQDWQMYQTVVENMQTFFVHLMLYKTLTLS